MNLRRRRRRRLILAVLAAAVIGAVLLIRLRYLPLVRSLVAAKIENEASDCIVAAIDRQIEQGNIQYERIIGLVTGPDGQVQALTTDMAEINRLKMEILHAIGAQISDLQEQSLSVPLGNVLAPALLSGVGGYVPVRLVELQTSGASFRSDFTAAGINQTLHRISLEVSVGVTVLTPAGLLTVPVSVEMVVAQTVIVGPTPQTLISTTGD